VRIVDEQTNTWGRAAGIEAQRTDLWVVDFREAIAGLRETSTVAQDTNTEFPNSSFLMSLSDILPTATLATYFCKSVSLPELRVRPDVVRRDSRPYNMPSWDDPLDPIRISFLLDCYKAGTVESPYQSDVYNVLDFWRALVRAGRGSMSEEYAIRLNNDYRVDYAFNVTVRLLRPGIPEVVTTSAPLNQFTGQQPDPFGIDSMFAASKAGQSSTARQGVLLPAPSSLNFSAVQNDLQEALTLKLVNCWLGSFKVSDLSYEQGRVAQIDATFYADNLQQPTQSAG
jgi:hypothetical protein